MRLVFAGTPEFARVAFEALRNAGHTIVYVLTQPDRRAGRGMKITVSPVKQAALAANIPISQPYRLRLDHPPDELAVLTCQTLEQLAPDAIIVAAYGLILPQWILHLPRFGCLNIHASLLPRWRGAAPIQRAIQAGDAQTGITIMQMDAGLDTGDMLLTRTVPISPEQTAGELLDTLAVMGGEAIVDTLFKLQSNEIVPCAQPLEGATYAAKLTKAETLLDCTKSAQQLAREVLAFNPAPGASIHLGDLREPVKVWRAQALANIELTPLAAPGKILNWAKQGIDIATSDGVLRLLELQKAGGKRLPVSSFIS